MRFAILALLGLVSVEAVKVNQMQNLAQVHAKDAGKIWEGCVNYDKKGDNTLLTYDELLNCYADYYHKHHPEKSREDVVEFLRGKADELWRRVPLNKEAFFQAINYKEKEDKEEHDRNNDDQDKPQEPRRDFSPEELFKMGDKDHNGILTRDELVGIYVDHILRYHPQGDRRGIEHYAKERMNRLWEQVHGEESELNFEMFRMVWKALGDEDRANHEKDMKEVQNAFKTCDADEDKAVTFQEGVQCYSKLLQETQQMDVEKANERAKDMIYKVWPAGRPHEEGLDIHQFRGAYRRGKEMHENEYNSDSDDEPKEDEAAKIFNGCNADQDEHLTYDELYKCAVDHFKKPPNTDEKEAENKAARKIKEIWPQFIDHQVGLTLDQFRTALKKSKEPQDEAAKIFASCNTNEHPLLQYTELLDCATEYYQRDENTDATEARNKAAKGVDAIWPADVDRKDGITLERFRQAMADSKKPQEPQDEAAKIFHGCNTNEHPLLQYTELLDCATKYYEKGEHTDATEARNKAAKGVDAIWPADVDRKDGITLERFRQAMAESKK